MSVSIHATGISADVIKILEAQGLVIKQNLDLEMPPFPKDITSVDDQELMTLASKYMENFNFMRTQVACAALAEMEAETKYSTAEAKAFLNKTNGKSTEKATMLKSAVITDPEIVELQQAKMHAYAYRKMIETMQDNIERNYSLVSRELTRRTSAMRNRF